jgi:hypothetical protein
LDSVHLAHGKPEAAPTASAFFFMAPLLKSADAGGIRILDLEPSFAWSRSIRMIAALRDEAFQAELAGVREDGGAVAFDVFAHWSPAGALAKPRASRAIKA